MHRDIRKRLSGVQHRKVNDGFKRMNSLKYFFFWMNWWHFINWNFLLFVLMLVSMEYVRFFTRHTGLIKSKKYFRCFRVFSGFRYLWAAKSSDEIIQILVLKASLLQLYTFSFAVWSRLWRRSLTSAKYCDLSFSALNEGKIVKDIWI